MRFCVIYGVSDVLPQNRSVCIYFQRSLRVSFTHNITLDWVDMIFSFAQELNQLLLLLVRPLMLRLDLSLALEERELSRM